MLDAHAGPLAPGAPLGDVYFPTSLRPMRADLLSRASWQIRTRAGADVYLRLPLDAAIAAVGEAALPPLFADMNRERAVRGHGDRMRPPTGRRIVADLPGDVRARRPALDLATLDPSSRLGLLAYRGATSIDPRLRLMLVSPVPGGPPDWADVACCRRPDAAAMAALTRRVCAARAGCGRTPPAALRSACRRTRRSRSTPSAARSATAPRPSRSAPSRPSLPPSAALAAAFSAATYPYRP